MYKNCSKNHHVHICISQGVIDSYRSYFFKLVALLHSPRFLLRFVKILSSQKSLSNLTVCAITLIQIKILKNYHCFGLGLGFRSCENEDFMVSL